MRGLHFLHEGYAYVDSCKGGNVHHFRFSLISTWPERVGVLMEVLIVLRPNGHRYDAMLDDTVLLTSDQPIVDAARRLLELGHPKKTLLRVRHEDASFDAFQPAKVGEWAKWTYVESARRPLQRVKYAPLPKGSFPCSGEAKSGGTDEA